MIQVLTRGAPALAARQGHVTESSPRPWAFSAPVWALSGASLALMMAVLKSLETGVPLFKGTKRAS